MAMFSNNIDIPLEIKRKIEYFIFFVKIKKLLLNICPLNRFRLYRGNHINND
jgi:hypothetical protein